MMEPEPQDRIGLVSQQHPNVCTLLKFTALAVYHKQEKESTNKQTNKQKNHAVQNTENFSNKIQHAFRIKVLQII